MDPSGSHVLLGTRGGELCSFSLSSSVFAGLFPVVTNGVGAVAVVDGSVVVGGGDGTVVMLRGRGKDWEVETSVRAWVWVWAWV